MYDVSLLFSGISSFNNDCAKCHSIISSQIQCSSTDPTTVEMKDPNSSMTNDMIAGVVAGVVVLIIIVVIVLLYQGQLKLFF